ncbi:MAG: hypothetical protein K2Y71_15460 [Xanthobacteraceae bacterium]|nr:hypothetical protein [Xanthobacteraceae bacterium]
MKKDVLDGEPAAMPPPVSTRAMVSATLVVAAIASLAITGMLHGNTRAAAQSRMSQPAPSVPTLPVSVPLDSGEFGPFAFGHLEFDWNPADGVPGFSAWPPGSPSR